MGSRSLQEREHRMLRVESVAWQTVGGWYFEFLSGSRGGKRCQNKRGLARSTSRLSVTQVKSVVCLSICAISRRKSTKRTRHGQNPGQAERDVIAPCSTRWASRERERARQQVPASSLMDGQSPWQPTDCAFHFHHWLHRSAPNDDTWQGSQTTPGTQSSEPGVTNRPALPTSPK